MTELSLEILDNLEIEKIIYAEYAPPGAMGNEGGVILYCITDDGLYCYEANIYKDENIYSKAVDILERNGITTRYNDIKNENGIFVFYGGGMGNNVFVNKNVALEIANGYFIYSKDGKKYKIYSSVEGVFFHVAVVIRRYRQSKKFTEFDDHTDYEDEEKKQNEVLRGKLDKKIIAGKIYTEKEINTILKTCCTSQDYVSFRRDLIDKGYLHRTNDCKAYWRNG